MADNPAVTALRAQTGDAHQALDRQFNAVARLAIDHERPDMLGRYYRFHAAAERAIAPFLASDPALDFPARTRSGLIAASIRAIGRTPPADLPSLAITSRPAALGALYVLEGSTLGGRMILRSLEDGGADTAALSFLAPYGVRAGEMWRAVLAVLDRDLSTNPEALAQSCAAASATFDLARLCLCDPEMRGPGHSGANLQAA